MKPTKIIYLFLFETLSDWEIGYVTAGINNPVMQVNPEKYQLKTFSIDGKPIRTIGGLLITPDLRLDEVTFSNAEMLILPGGASWDEGGNQEVALLAKNFHENQIKAAAICGATLGLAKIGLLDSIQHTSNSKDYLLNSHYQGGEYYVDVLSVSECSRGLTKRSSRPKKAAHFSVKVLMKSKWIPISLIIIFVAAFLLAVGLYSSTEWVIEKKSYHLTKNPKSTSLFRGVKQVRHHTEHIYS
jgi:putative intracellular protease/amidase